MVCIHDSSPFSWSPLAHFSVHQTELSGFQTNRNTRNRLLDVSMNVDYIKNSLRLDSPEMEQIKASAKANSIAVSLGFSENDNNSLYIAQVLIGPDGEIKVHHRKMKPTHMERTIFGDSSGHCLSSVAELPFGRVGALSCWEHIQPLLKFHTFAQGEDIHVAAWPSLTPHSGPEGNDLWSMSAEGKRECFCSLRKFLFLVSA